MEIYLLDQQNQRRYGICLKEVFPKTITASSLNFNSATEILKTNVTFAFKYWTNLDQKQQKADIAGKILTTLVSSVSRNIDNNIPRILSRLSNR